MFQPVNSRVNFPELEKRVLEFWRQGNIFQRSVEARSGGPRFTLYEGPPTANGRPGIHHVLARVFKDIIARYQVMKGHYAPRIAGWDTHGLPVELEVEKQLGLTSKAQIEQYGIGAFNARCRESVFRYLKDWESITERIGFWVDLDKAYVTMDNRYIESVWWAINELWDRGFIYQGYRVTPHCPRCGTSLSSHEVALGYQDDIPDPSVYIKFRLVKGPEGLRRDKPVYLLAWTTTPWTLPANTALAVAPDAEYVVMGNDREYLILASARVEAAGPEGYSVAGRIAGGALIGTRYEPLFNPHAFGVERRRFQGSILEVQPPDEELTYRVIGGDFVGVEDGTGIVHIAPAYGEVDYQAGCDQGLDFVHVVDLQGKITGTFPFAGKFVKAADKEVLADLAARDLLLRSETIRHTYPFCWRCQTPLLYYAKQTWYIRTTSVKDALIEGNREINWYPGHIKYGRFGDWLENNVDWAFSRERYWGTPLPVWRCETCGACECIGAVQELRDKPGFSGLGEPVDLHRPFVDEAFFACERCGGRMKRVPEVIDCWFDSGAMPIAQLHYPFENKELFDNELKQADYISEAVDQTRGWFYSLHAISTLLFNRPCYKNVICLGHILDAKGEKMSKARGNVVEPWKVIDKYGADALRWYFYTSGPPGNVRRFTDESVGEVVRRFMLTLWNVYSFFVTYANIDRFTPGATARIEPSELDCWIISELNQLTQDVDTALGGYSPTEAARQIECFVDNLSNWYVRRSRRRFWKSGSDADKLAAYATLYECLVTTAKLMAPFTPFLAEELYQNLVRAISPEAPDSVHLADFPNADGNKIDRQLSEDVALAMRLSSLGRAARSQAQIKVRQPLDRAVVSLQAGREKRGLERVKPQVLEELNIKDIEVVDDMTKMPGEGYAVCAEGGYAVAVPTEVSADLLAEGMAREIVHRLQTMRREAGFDIADHIVTYYRGDDYIDGIMAGFSGYIRQETLSRELVNTIPPDDAGPENYKLSGHAITLGVKRV